ncbi:MAG: LPXTG cell wall anchor domain-containing protein [Rubrobacteraceae bacterium]|nr:LPXTG cell wall anchor domain-containing protein [Rubrobacteraceae bacterium]
MHAFLACLLVLVLVVPAAFAQSVSCAGFHSQWAAQQYYDFLASPAEKQILDPDGNGYACDNGTITGPRNPTSSTPASDQYSAPVSTAPSTAAATALPDTGGVSPLAPGFAVLLLGGGLFLIARRVRQP